MHVEPPPLPYAKNVPEPYISRRIPDCRSDRHRGGHLEKPNAAIANEPGAEKALAELMIEPGKRSGFAAQAWDQAAAEDVEAITL